MAIIQEKGMVRAIKGAYRHGGYNVLNLDGDVVIYTEEWCVRCPWNKLPRKALATIVGSILGIISGYFGKAYAQIIMRTLDIFYAFPSILLAIALSSVLGSGLSSIIIPIAVILVPPIAQVAESTVQDIMPEDFIEAAQTSGASPLKVIVFFIIPNTFGRIFIYCTTQFSVSILSASGLSFLGLGISPPTPEWGSMLNALRQQIYINPLITIIPGLFIFVTALSVNIISDGLKEAMEANS